MKSKSEKDLAFWKNVYNDFSDALILAHIKDLKERPITDQYWQDFHLTLLNTIACERKLSI